MDAKLVIIAVMIVVYAIVKAVAKTASEKKTARGRGVAAQRPVAASRQPAAAPERVAACPPAPAPVMDDSEAVAHFAPREERKNPATGPKTLPGGVSARDAVIWGEVLRRRF